MFGYAFLLCTAMIAIPFAEVIKKVILKVVFMRRMKIEYFSYQFKPVELVQERDGQRFIDMYEHPDFVIEGSTILLHWSVPGAVLVFLSPHGVKVNGNVAEVVVDRNRRRFKLTSRGLFSKEVALIEIPLSKIKAIDTNALSNTKMESNIARVGSSKLSRAQVTHQMLKEDLTTKLLVKKKTVVCAPKRLIPLSLGGRKFYQSPDISIKLKRAIETKISAGVILRSYIFSTSKYNKVNRFNQPNV